MDDEKVERVAVAIYTQFIRGASGSLTFNKRLKRAETYEEAIARRWHFAPDAVKASFIAEARAAISAMEESWSR